MVVEHEHRVPGVLRRLDGRLPPLAGPAILSVRFRNLGAGRVDIVLHPQPHDHRGRLGRRDGRVGPRDGQPGSVRRPPRRARPTAGDCPARDDQRPPPCRCAGRSRRILRPGHDQRRAGRRTGRCNPRDVYQPVRHGQRPRLTACPRPPSRSCCRVVPQVLLPGRCGPVGFHDHGIAGRLAVRAAHADGWREAGPGGNDASGG